MKFSSAFDKKLVTIAAIFAAVVCVISGMVTISSIYQDKKEVELLSQTLESYSESRSKLSQNASTLRQEYHAAENDYKEALKTYEWNKQQIRSGTCNWFSPHALQDNDVAYTGGEYVVFVGWVHPNGNNNEKFFDGIYIETQLATPDEYGYSYIGSKYEYDDMIDYYEGNLVPIYYNKEYTVRLYFDLRDVTQEEVREKIVSGRPVVLYGFVQVDDDGDYSITECSFNDYDNDCFADNNEFYAGYNPDKENLLSIMQYPFDDRGNINVLCNTYGYYAGGYGISTQLDAYDSTDDPFDGPSSFFLTLFTDYSLKHMFDEYENSGREYYYNNGNPNAFEDAIYDGFDDICESIYGVDPSIIWG